MSDTFRYYELTDLGPDGYPHAWHRTLKHAVREEAGHRCVRCHHPYVCGESPGQWSPCDEQCTHDGPIRSRMLPELDWKLDDAPGAVPELLTAGFEVEARWRILTVHHLDGDKANCRWWNLAPLCQRCHLTVQGKVVMDRRWHHEHSEWFRPYVAGYYAHVYLGEDLTREETVARLDELLSLEVRQESLVAHGEGR